MDKITRIGNLMERKSPQSQMVTGRGNSLLPEDSSGRWEIIRYRPEMAGLWNEKVAESRNGTFLHDRRFMDYHSDRFEDHSLIALKDGKPIAILPANITGDGILHSHQGLTYGGWLTPKRHFDGTDMLHLFDAWTAYCRENEIREIDYKAIPFIYWELPAAEDEYALWRNGAQIAGVNLSSCFEIACRPEFEKRQKRNLKKPAGNGGLEITKSKDAERFISFVNTCLAERHQTQAVHTGEELAGLMKDFPDNIELWVLTDDNDEWHSGICIFNTGRVVHIQYIATSPTGRADGSLAKLFDYVIGQYPEAKWFDYGISNEEGGHVLNSGLHLQKTELGGRGITYSRYTLKI